MAKLPVLIVRMVTLPDGITHVGMFRGVNPVGEVTSRDFSKEHHLLTRLIPRAFCKADFRVRLVLDKESMRFEASVKVAFPTMHFSVREMNNALRGQIIAKMRPLATDGDGGCRTEVYVDGSFRPESGESGIGIYVPLVEAMFSYSTHGKFTTSTEVEAFAVAMGSIVGQQFFGGDAVLLSDCLSIVREMSGDSAQKFLAARDARNRVVRAGQQVHWVKGHKGIVGNEIADRLARAALTGKISRELKDRGTLVYRDLSCMVPGPGHDMMVATV